MQITIVKIHLTDGSEVFNLRLHGELRGELPAISDRDADQLMAKIETAIMEHTNIEVEWADEITEHA